MSNRKKDENKLIAKILPTIPIDSLKKRAQSIFNYCCPLNWRMWYNVPSDRRFYAVGSLQFHFQAPLFKIQLQLGWRVVGGSQYLLPLLLRVFEEKAVVHVAHEQYPDHGGQPGEAPRPFERPLYQCQQQVCDECHPYLDLDGIGTLPIEVTQGEILFYLPKEVM